MGEYFYKTVFPAKKAPGAIFEHACEATFIDSFTSEQEYFFQRQYYPTDTLVLSVCFPIGRLCKKCKCLCVSSGYEAVVDNGVHVSAGGEMILWIINNPQLNSTYKITWTW